ncbi:eCIS core domain-containing protein [Streptomyces sp. CA-111067]|uniref:eCIS core domain-containing protein n=1 Tax=Streptomyces sp. CA-111067 TaxID=3240046 RepID=UPI003D990867
MRSQDQTSDTKKQGTAAARGAGARRGGPAKAPAIAANHAVASRSPQAVLALQRSAGNAAVAQLAEQEQHVHDGGCGHQQPPRRSGVEAGLSTPGTPLDQATLARKEEQFQADLSRVRVHTGSAARQAAASVQARAFTVDQDIVIGAGGDDSLTLDHEITHTVRNQQRASVGHPTGGGFNMTHPQDAEEREAQSNAARMGSGGPSSVRGEGPGIQRTADARSAVLPHLQRYAAGTAPAAPAYDQSSGDQLPAFALTQPSVTVRLEGGTFHGSLTEHVAASEPVALSWSNDRTMAMNSQHGAKEFYAVPAVIAAANRSLAETGSYMRLSAGGHSLPGSSGEKLTVVRPRAATDLDDAVLTRFMHLVQHECVEVAEKLTTGGLLGQAVFRGPDGRGVSADIGSRGGIGLPRLAGALSSGRPPTTPREAAQAAQGADPARAPGAAYGTSLRNGQFTASEHAIGINESARAKVGEALTTRTIDSEPRAGVDKKFDHYRNRVPTERIWPYHYGTVVAQSSDGADQISLENFNRTSLMTALLHNAAVQTAGAYVRANPGKVMSEEEARQVARGLLEREVKSAMGGMWYFKMYEPGGERSFHGKNRATALNPLTVVTTQVPRLRFEERSDVLTNLSKSQLEKTAAMWQQSTAPIVVEGHARGGAIALRNLAEKRAGAVVAELVRLGIDRGRITVKANSQSDQPFASVYPADRPEEYVPGGRS